MLNKLHKLQQKLVYMYYGIDIIQLNRDAVKNIL
jgi:hypothetical protein